MKRSENIDPFAVREAGQKTDSIIRGGKKIIAEFTSVIKAVRFRDSSPRIR